jgi:class 3 adenylate cyclase
VRTLVFTDLVGTLELKRTEGEGAAAAKVERHRQLLRRLLDQAGGREVDNPGDGFFLVFRRAADAVAFALRLQAAHAAAPDLPPVRVGIHRGAVDERAGGTGDLKPLLVEGIAVDLAARLCPLANPGQVLGSIAALDAARATILAPDLPPVEWRHHGPFLLQGLEDAPVEVAEVAVARLAEGLEPPRGSAKARRCAGPEGGLLADRYRLGDELGRGSAGIVLAAHDERLDRPVAIKRLPVGRATPSQVERLRREAKLAAKLGDHPGIVAAWDLGTDLGTWPETGEPFLVLERVDGPSLAEVLSGDAPPDRAAGLRWVGQVARAVGHAHDHGVVHRDLKPANVLIGPDGAARVTDFGVARALGNPGSLTETGHTLGTPAYVAPEQLDDPRAVGPPADVYGLGGLLYAVLTGRSPFDSGSWRATLVAVLRGALVPPREHDPTVPPRLDALCRQALALDPAQRPASAAAFAQALEGA